MLGIVDIVALISPCSFKIKEGSVKLMEKNNLNIAKPKWDKPKLIVLMRGKQEEEILAVCKSDGSGLGPSSGYPGCMWGCGDCSNLTIS